MHPPEPLPPLTLITHPPEPLPPLPLYPPQVRRTRTVQRAARRRSGKPVIAVVGYTNAGKSSLVGALAKADVGVEDRWAGERLGCGI